SRAVWNAGEYSFGIRITVDGVVEGLTYLLVERERHKVGRVALELEGGEPGRAGGVPDRPAPIGVPGILELHALFNEERVVRGQVDDPGGDVGQECVGVGVLLDHDAIHLGWAEEIVID